MIDVLVLCRDHPEYLTQCIAHLEAQDVPYHGVLIDNSEHNRDARIVAHDAGWSVIDGGPHLNYSQSLNLGIRWTTNTHVMWLSDDAYLHNGALAALVAAAKPVVTPLLLNSNNTVCFAGGAFNGMHPHHVGRGDDPQDWQGRGTYETDWITTPAALFERRVLEAVGPLDEGYDWCFEDVDYCLRARQAGFDMWVCADAVCTHDEVGTKTRSGILPSSRRFKDKWQGVLV